MASAGRARVQDRHRQVDGEVQQQERFGAGEQRRFVAQHAPGGADGKSGKEPEQVQHAPVPPQRDAHHGEVQQRVPAEQQHMVAAAGRHQQWRGKAGKEPEHRQCARVLSHREQAGRRHQHQQQGERGTRRQQVVEAERGKHHQHQRTDRAALRREGEAAPARAFAPAECQRRHGSDGDAREAQFDRQAQPAFRGGVFQQRADAGEQHKHADLDRHVAAAEPARHPRERSRSGGRARRHRGTGHGWGWARWRHRQGVDQRRQFPVGGGRGAGRGGMHCRSVRGGWSRRRRCRCGRRCGAVAGTKLRLQRIDAPAEALQPQHHQAEGEAHQETQAGTSALGKRAQHEAGQPAGDHDHESHGVPLVTRVESVNRRGPPRPAAS